MPCSAACGVSFFLDEEELDDVLSYMSRKCWYQISFHCLEFKDESWSECGSFPRVTYNSMYM